MKRVLFLLACSVSFCLVASADPCVDGSLASYEALGATGCTIGTNLVSSFATLSGISGATKIDESEVLISPSGGTAAPQFIFSFTKTAQAGDLLESIFTYKIAGNPYTQSDISLGSASETGNGAVTGIQNLCVDGTFGPDGVSGCTGSSSLALLTLDGIQNADQAAFLAAFLSVTDDFTVDGGPDGTATGGVFTDKFTSGTTVPSVPEPRFVGLFAAVVLAFAAAWKRRFVSLN